MEILIGRFSCVRMIGLLVGLFLLSGCSQLTYRATGQVLTHYSEQEAVPYLLASDDPDMACALSEAFGPFMFSFEKVGASAEKMKILLYMMAGSCAESRSWNPELRYLRALRRNDATETQDALIEQKRFLLQAAQRDYLSYSTLVKIMGNGETCPRFANSQDEFLWLVGLLSGLQAVFADIAVEHQSNVSLDTTQKVAHAATCLDSARWWGVPLAIQSAVAASLPASDETIQAALKNLAVASAMGVKQKVRLAQVLEAQIYFSKGKTDQVKRVIREYAQEKKQTPADPAMKLFDQVAAMQLLAISDRLWTEAKGVRTPLSGFGTFWDDVAPAADGDKNSLLDGL